jgi:hypothetical protein
MQAVSAGALVAVRHQFILQTLLVGVMSLALISITAIVGFLVIRFAIRSPGLLFNPQDIAAEVHRDLYLPVNPEQIELRVEPLLTHFDVQQ